MSLRLPRHQGAKASAKHEAAVEVPQSTLPSAESVLEELGDDTNDESLNEVKKAEHRFDPPLPPEPPPRDVTVGGVSLDPPLDTSKQSRQVSDSKNSDSSSEENLEDDEKVQDK
jgi:hypothetical protein